jgi:hypothetical protein
MRRTDARMQDGSAALMLAACALAGVILGAYDARIVRWLAGFEPQAAAAIAGIIARAGAGSRLAADVAHLLDEGYSIRLDKAAPGYGTGDVPGYLARLAGPLGSEWHGTGPTPAEALRSAWPFSDDTDASDPGGPAGDDADEASMLDSPDPTCAVCGVMATEDGHAPQASDSTVAGQ